jgi:hypothetical protein
MQKLANHHSTAILIGQWRINGIYQPKWKLQTLQNTVTVHASFVF